MAMTASFYKDIEISVTPAFPQTFDSGDFSSHLKTLNPFFVRKGICGKILRNITRDRQQ